MPKYMLEKRTAYGRTIYAVVETPDFKRTLARCDTAADAQLIILALDTMWSAARDARLEGTSGFYRERG
jgi:hypothetical protein